jgi:hypothetical protein
MAARVTKVSIAGAGKVLEVLGEAAISPNQEKAPATGRPTMPFMSSLRLTNLHPQRRHACTLNVSSGATRAR